MRPNGELALFVALGFGLWSFFGCPEDADDDVADDDVADDDVADDDVADDDVADDDTGDDDTAPAEEIDPQRIYDDVALLASDEWGGRAPATEGNEAAVEYARALFEDLGLQPAGDGSTFLQTFGYESWEQLAPAEMNLDGEDLVDGTDLSVFYMSGNGSVTADVVFIGYGLTVPAFDAASHPACPIDPAGYDDYDGIDVTGKIVLLLRHGPGEDQAVSDDCPGNAASQGGDLWTFGYKAANAALHGAAAMVLVGDYNHGPEAVEGYIGSDYYQPDLPAVSPRRNVVESHLPDLESWYDEIEAAWQPASRDTGVSATVTVDAGVVEIETSNVLGAIPGTDPAIGDEIVIYGAHIDHLGTAANGDIYNGADDNASGSAVVMEMARMLAGSGYQPARTVLFQLYNAEEVGLIGSCHYVSEPTHPLEDAVAMLSIDMVGAGDGTGLILYGSDYEPFAWLTDLATAASDDAGLSYDVWPGPTVMASDHACFAWLGIPAVLVSTLGPHAYYHTPEDTIDNILIDDLEAAARILWSTLEPLAMGEEDLYLEDTPAAAMCPASPTRSDDLSRIQRDR